MIDLVAALRSFYAHAGPVAGLLPIMAADEITRLHAELATCEADRERDFEHFRKQMQQSTAQALAPLTDAQIDEMLTARHFDTGYRKLASDYACVGWYRMGLREGERAHGIGAEVKR